MKRLSRAVVIPLALVALISDVLSPAYGASSPSLFSATTYGVLATTYSNPVPGTTINGDVGFTTAPAVAPAGIHTNYGSAAPYAAAGADQASALALLASQPCSFTFPATAIDLATDVSHGPVGVYTPGVYCTSTSSITTIGVGGITLNGAGSFIFRLGNVLSTAANSVVHLVNGATACNTWWTPSAGPILSSLGADSIFAGTYIDPSTGITINNNVSWSGRALAYGGYVKTSIDDTITVPSCSIQEPSLLRVVKTVVNSNGSTAVASDFTLHVKLSGVEVAGSPAVGLVSPGRDYWLTNGSTYVVSENAQPDYLATFGGDCNSSGAVTLGSTPKTCTITNTHISPSPSPSPTTTEICTTVQGGAGPVTTCVTTTVSPTPSPSPSPTTTTTCTGGGATPQTCVTTTLSPTPSPSPADTSGSTPSPTPTPSPSGTGGTPKPNPSPSVTPGTPGTSITPTAPWTMITTSGPVLIPTFPHTGLSSSTRYLVAETRVGTPVRLMIPSIKVNAVVERIGLTADKEVGVPQGHGHVGWYQFGPKPGDEGSAIIDGHFARKTSGWAVFNDLYKLRKGDKLSVRDSNGKVLNFVVQSSRVYDVKAHPSEVYVSDSGSHLNLVTCIGTWINSLHGFDRRLVVFTDLVS